MYSKLQKRSAFFAQNKCKSANMGSSTVQLHGVDLIDIQIQIDYKNLFVYNIKCM